MFIIVKIWSSIPLLKLLYSHLFSFVMVGLQARKDTVSTTHNRKKKLTMLKDTCPKVF